MFQCICFLHLSDVSYRCKINPIHILYCFQDYIPCLPLNAAAADIPDDIVNPHNDATIKRLQKDNWTKEAIAASVFKQMLMVLKVMKEDLDHRVKLL